MGREHVDLVAAEVTMHMQLLPRLHWMSLRINSAV